MKKMTNEDRIKRWLSDELSASEKKEFESTGTFAKINRLLTAVSAFKAPGYDINKEYLQLSENLIHKKRTISLYQRISPLFKIAAIIIIALTIGYFSYTHLNPSSVNQQWIAEQTEIYLPDSSFVLLNADSKIRYLSNEWKKERNVELNGEAFFKVKKGSHFSVKTQQGMVTVLGTEFNVKDRDSYYEVTCYSGLVKVVTSYNSVILKPNTAYRIVKGKEDNYSIHNQTEPNWLNGESSFNSVPFSFVIKELERQYKVSVVTRDIDLNQLFTGGFTHKNLELALKSITIPVNLKYLINEKQIVITFESK